MESCSKCGAELPELTLERDYDAEIDQELYELEHPVRTRTRKFFGSYGEYLIELVFGDAEEEIALQEKIAKIREEKGRFAASWYEIKRKLWMVLAAFLWLGWVVLASIPFSEIESERLVWLGWGGLSLLPLWGVSIWILVRKDKREISTTKKALQHAWGALNALAFGILYLAMAIVIVRLATSFIFPD